MSWLIPDEPLTNEVTGIDQLVEFLKDPSSKILSGAKALNDLIESNVEESKFLARDPKEWAQRRQVLAGQNIDKWLEQGGMADLAMMGTLHGTKSKRFGGKQMIDKLEGYQKQGMSPRQIWDKTFEETGFGYFPQHYYDKTGKLKRTDWKMNVPNLGLKEGKTKLDNIAELDKRQSYSLTDFADDPLLKIGYPSIFANQQVNILPDLEMDMAKMQFKPGKYGKPDLYRINEELADIEEDIRPTWAHDVQHKVDELEGHPQGASTLDPNYLRVSGEVDARAVEDEMQTILDLREQGMSDAAIRNYLGRKRPIFETFDTPDIMRIINDRRSNLSDRWQAAKNPDLIATRQISSNWPLSYAVQEGGMVNPSMAIQYANDPMLEGTFGDITLIGDKNLIAGADLYSGDAFTPVFPSPKEIQENQLYTLNRLSNYMNKQQQLGTGAIEEGVKRFESIDEMLKAKESMENIFEAKFTRPVKLGEYKGALVPSYNFERVGPILKEQGIEDIKPYTTSSGEYEQLLRDYFKYLHFGQLANQNIENIV